jgi:DNA-binding GntR family transcriptional regulator
MSELMRKSTVDQAADHLRERILRGEMAPGTPLREAALAKRLGVSRNTLRETLFRLERDALVRHEAHRGAAVASPGSIDVDDIFAVRQLLESAGLDRAAEGPAARAALRAAVDDLEARAEAADWEGYAIAEGRFHGALVDALGSPRMSELYRRCLGELRLALIEVDQSIGPHAPRPYVGEHRAIVERLEAGRIEAARALLARHLDEARGLVRGAAGGNRPSSPRLKRG